MVTLTGLVHGNAVLYFICAFLRLAAAMAPALHLFAITVSSCTAARRQE